MSRPFRIALERLLRDRSIQAATLLHMPYVTVSAHSRHMQQSCCLDTAVARQSFQRDAEWARA